jgi:predicted methyltransferase
MRALSMLLSASLLCLGACSTHGSATAAIDSAALVETATTAAALVPTVPTVPSVADRVAAALADPKRVATDRERDERDHPQELLTLAGFKEGDAIADIFGGAGYYSEIIADIVGPTGSVRLINNTPYDGYSKKGRESRLAGNRLPNVRYEVLPPSAMNLGQGTLDGALIVMSYHDLYVVDPKDDWPAIDAAQFIDQIVAGLKPGGRLLIVDHQARPGTGKGDAQVLHRIEDSFAVADFKAHGLELVGTLDLLRNADDDHSKNVFDPAIRGKTDRFVQVYRKP